MSFVVLFLLFAVLLSLVCFCRTQPHEFFTDRLRKWAPVLAKDEDERRGCYYEMLPGETACDGVLTANHNITQRPGLPVVNCLHASCDKAVAEVRKEVVAAGDDYVLINRSRKVFAGTYDKSDTDWVGQVTSFAIPHESKVCMELSFTSEDTAQKKTFDITTSVCFLKGMDIQIDNVGVLFYFRPMYVTDVYRVRVYPEPAQAEWCKANGDGRWVTTDPVNGKWRDFQFGDEYKTRIMRMCGAVGVVFRYRHYGGDYGSMTQGEGTYTHPKDVWLPAVVSMSIPEGTGLKIDVTYNRTAASPSETTTFSTPGQVISVEETLGLKANLGTIDVRTFGQKSSITAIRVYR